MSDKSWDSIAPAPGTSVPSCSSTNRRVSFESDRPDPLEDCGSYEEAPEESAVFEVAMKPRDSQVVMEHSIPKHVFDVQKPWLDEHADTIWHPSRVIIAKAILSKPMELGIAFIIVLNVALIIYETDQEAKCFPTYNGDDLDQCPSKDVRWLVVGNNVFLAIYSVEAAFSIFALQRLYFKKPACLFDFFVCFCGWFSLLFGAIVNISWLRILRCGRILKALHFINHIPELYMLFAGFGAAMKAVLFGGLALLGMLGFCSILTVQLVHPVNAAIGFPGCERCSRGFSSVASSMLTLFQQIVAGDAWGQISVPIVENDKIGLLLPLIQLVIGVGAMNLILAVVVDRSVEAREANQQRIREEEMEERKERKKSLLQLLRSMDYDGSDSIDREEIEKAKRSNPEFQKHLFLSGVEDQELEELIINTQNPHTGETPCLELCHGLYAVQGADVRKTVVLLKSAVDAMSRTMIQRMDVQDKNLAAMREQLTEFQQSRGSQLFSRASVSSQLDPVISSEPPDVNGALCGEPSEDVMKASVAFANRPFLVSPCVCRDAVQSFEAQIAKEAERLQQSAATLDACWTDALSLINHASVFLREGDEQSVDQTPCVFEEVREHLNVAQLNSHDRRCRLFEDITADLATDADFLVSHCKLLSRCERAFVDKSSGNDRPQAADAWSPNSTIPWKP